MNAIVIKYKDKILDVFQVSSITTKKFCELKNEAENNVKSLVLECEHQIDRISQLEEHTLQLEETIKNLQHQINVLSGEEE